MPDNYYLFFVVAIIPLIIGAIYYHPKVFGSAWMKANGFTEESLQGGNMAKIFGLTYLYSFFIAFILPSVVVHQSHVLSLFMPEVMESGDALQLELNEFMSRHGGRFRSFGHGALHAAILSVFFVLPLISINSLFERRGWKYILIHFGYWLISLMLMGGILCKTLEYSPLS